jgi:tetratricopeptide (TPR) repeat protein
MTVQSDDGNDIDLGGAVALAGVAVVAAGIWSLFKGSDEENNSYTSVQSEVQILFDSANKSAQQGNYDQAVQLLFEILKKNSSHAPTYNFLAWIYAIHKYQLDQALEFSNKAVALAGNSIERAFFIDTLAEVYAHRGDLNQSIALSSEFLNTLNALGQKPQSPVTYFRLAWCYQISQDFNNTYVFLQQALQVSGLGSGEYATVGDICHAMASVYFGQGFYNEAMGHYENAGNQYQIATQLATEEKLQDDLFRFKWSICLNDKGAAFYHLEEYENSKQCHQTAYNICQFNPYPVINLAMLEAKEKNRQKMLYWLERGMSLLVDIPPFIHKEHLIFVILNDLDFEDYRNDVLGLLLRSGKITTFDYERALTTWMKRAAKSDQPVNFSQQNFYSSVGGVAGNVEGNFTSRPQNPNL